ncbi:hypothetical protein [Halorientalis sp.]|uniref:hypothetical protein n=1 Tax=Halorientalis sp. TaxID=1931229 RepID=UPI0032C22705
MDCPPVLSERPKEYYGVDLLDVRTVLTNGLTDPTAIEGWQVYLDDRRPEVTKPDFSYAESPED